MFETVKEIVTKIGNRKLTWGVGGSLLLNFHSLIEHPNDIDLLVKEEDEAVLNEILSSMGTSKEAKSFSPFRTVHFSKFKIGKVDIDSMGGFAIQHNEGIYRLQFDENSVVERIDGIPLSSLEDWYVLYWLIPNKQEKAIMIEDYFKKNGVRHPRLLEKALGQPLPNAIKERVQEVLKKYS
ncbi:nucleotidyltransferase domain-containing protein [Bacillus timonensis]|uniref:nucleotidyltransferase domain-containing protein n=1 Tax=Bacillus timonensis TaxID=1033734 RepID=UPI000288A7DF|nr:hypothetical protein [Bacillus timonensis]